MQAQIANSVNNTERSQPTLESLGFFGNNSTYMLHFLQTQVNTALHFSLQVIQIVEMHPWQGCDCRIDVTWERDIDEKQRATRALLHHLLHQFGCDNCTRSLRRTNNDISLD